MRQVGAVEARSAIAHHMLGSTPHAATIGSVTLYPHQVEAARRIDTLLDQDGGALLADEVGLGKTFTALAVARGRHALVIGPAAVRDAWRDAFRLAATTHDFISMESLSRAGEPPAPRVGLVIIDEAHHFRNAATRRFAAARDMCGSAHVLLLTATPVQNSERDLRVMLSLFLGERAHALSSRALARHIVRRTAQDVATPAETRLPVVGPVTWLECVPDDDCLDRILALPPPLPPRDGGDAGGLAAYSLARQWTSSRAALNAALRRRLARGLAMMEALHAGRLPTRAELTAWAYADGALQLSFPELVVATPELSDADALIRQVELHMAGLRDLAGWLGVTPDPDVHRAARLRAVLRSHPGERVVAFSEHTATVAALYTRLVQVERVAQLTHSGGRVAGGAVSRAEVIARFAPVTAARFPASERIDLLLTTDVLSEGVGLHDASVVIHLDLTWNPARLEQRVGRLRRLGAARDTVHVYAMPPAAPAERLLRMEERLRRKIAEASRTVGIAGQIIPDVASAPQRSAAEREERIASMLLGWQTGAPPTDPVVAAVRAQSAGALVVARHGAQPILIACDGQRVSDSGELVGEMLSAAGGAGCDVPVAVLAPLVRRVEQWLERSRLGAVVDLASIRVAQSRRWALRRADGIARRTPRHAQPRVALLVHAVRAAATATLSAGAERVFDELARAPLPDDAWLQAVRQFAELHARPAVAESRVEVVLLLVPPV